MWGSDKSSDSIPFKQSGPEVIVDAQSQFKKESLQSALAVTFYMTVSIGLVMINRHLLTSKEKAGALFISWYQFVVAYVIIVIITNFFPNVPLLNLFPPIKYNLATVKKVLPVSAAYLCMIGFNNKCLEYVSVSAYQIVRSLTIMFNIILSYYVLDQKTSCRAICACLGVVVGFLLGVEGEINLSFRGAVYGVLSSAFVALYSIVVKRALGVLDNNEYVLIEYNTPIATVLLTPFVYYAGEFDVFSPMRSVSFWFAQTLGGVVGFIINIAIYINIKYTTPLTHNLSGTVKACLQTLLAMVIFPNSETMPFMKLVGTIFIIGFSAYYAYVRRSEMKKKADEKEKLAKEALNNEKDDNLSSVVFQNVEDNSSNASNNNQS